MIDTNHQRKIVVAGLTDYTGKKMIRSNQNQEPPDFPYVTYTITTLSGENKGTYAEWDDHVARKPHIQVYSITAYSNEYNEAVTLANQCHEWLDYVGSEYLNDNNVIVQSVGNITDRSNVLTNEYLYAYGFDCFFWVYDEIQKPDYGTIETVFEYEKTKKER